MRYAPWSQLHGVLLPDNSAQNPIGNRFFWVFGVETGKRDFAQLADLMIV
jgi:hypothetical protein